ncbi:hypothetical protein A5789_18220 [Nocardia sp. 852002-51101_SCH5132738]|uniref:Uncharacterized protein n=1 Tax=Nocardia nova TaxID=37330 RepID=A0A2S6A979_9NOCA|nr:hypothetical protein A5789_18220 [Nocardia sp. 852002-51101_SCH5132738]OBB45043.1 hypothetical protein A5748_26865 [Nocardia sp. 852002-51244_SCH5132740]OBF69387.1 hypothetical protein A9X06_03975 [Mycobacterium sp. 852002-51759_SCH5129042]PPI98279.1 hypothetical protein C5E46_11440 [Nocardia nova]PPJ10013.1 hypothetical protein C5E51_12270 [Nocardia nova]
MMQSLLPVMAQFARSGMTGSRLMIGVLLSTLPNAAAVLPVGIGSVKLVGVAEPGLSGAAVASGVSGTTAAVAGEMTARGAAPSNAAAQRK